MFRQLQKEIEAKIPEEAMLGGCLYFAAYAQKLIGAEVLAGTASWRTVDSDIGSADYFQYLYTEQATIPQLDEADNGAIVALPEMHIWNFYKGQYLDLTTKFWPAHCEQILGRRWPGRKPPDVFYGKPQPSFGPHPLWQYIPNKQATKIANDLIPKLDL